MDIMRIYVVLFLIVGLHFGYSQSKFKTASGEISFNASTPLEDIVATNNKTNAIFDTESGDFAAVLLIKEFDFPNDLMEEHFNENYLESEAYPKGYFSGSVENYNWDRLSESPELYKIRGKLTIHGVTKDVSEDIELSKTSNGLLLKSMFILKPQEFNIKVPRIIFKKIAKEVETTVHFEMYKN
jgi:hypothetical protein